MPLPSLIFFGCTTSPLMATFLGFHFIFWTSLNVLWTSGVSIFKFQSLAAHWQKYPTLPTSLVIPPGFPMTASLHVSDFLSVIFCNLHISVPSFQRFFSKVNMCWMPPLHSGFKHNMRYTVYLSIPTEGQVFLFHLWFHIPGSCGRIEMRRRSQLHSWSA